VTADLLIAVPLGFVLGFFIGLTGVGGGALVAPALYVIPGVPYGQAVTSRGSRQPSVGSRALPFPGSMG